MADTFTRLYGATPFDPEKRSDQIGEAVRRLVIDAALQARSLHLVQGQDDVPPFMGGLMVGFVQIMQAVLDRGDDTDAAIRASIMQLAPWAVDMARAQQGKEPLANA